MRHDSMSSSSLIALVVFVGSVLYAVLGNLFVYVALLRRGVAVRSMWVGMPGYLYRLCISSGLPPDAPLVRFARSTGFAYLVAAIVGIGVGALEQH